MNTPHIPCNNYVTALFLDDDKNIYPFRVQAWDAQGVALIAVADSSSLISVREYHGGATWMRFKGLVT